MRSSIFRLKRQLMANPPELLLHGGHWTPEPMDLDGIDDPLGRDGDVVRLDTDVLRKLFAAGLDRGAANDTSDKYALDRWLAPRLHAAVRVPRRVACDPRFWGWISMTFASNYVRDRFGEGGKVAGWRYTGAALRNGVSRLWWAAELLRNGSDYSTVDKALRKVRTAQFALELAYSWYRPAAIAFAEVADGDGLSDEDMNAVSRRSNAYLPLAPLEAIGFDSTDGVVDDDWWHGECTLGELTDVDPPPGPEDGFADPDAVAAIARWYREVLSEERANRRTSSAAVI